MGDDRSFASRHEAIAALQDRGISGRCEACGKDPTQWVLASDNDTTTKASMLYGDSGAMTHGPLSVIPFLTLICTNCGYTRLYSVEYLAKAISDGRA